MLMEMGLEMRPALTLSDFEECVLCLEVVPTRLQLKEDFFKQGYSEKLAASMAAKQNSRSRDHLFPSAICLKYSDALRGIAKSPDDWADICLDCHRKRDWRKLDAYYGKNRQPSIARLINAVAQYRRSPDPEILEIQAEQFQRLYRAIYGNLKNLNGHTPKERKEDYDSAKIVLAAYLDFWADGYFEDVVDLFPTLDLSTQTM